MNANPVNWVARLPRMRCLRFLDGCLIFKESKTLVVIFYYILLNVYLRKAAQGYDAVAEGKLL